MVSSPERVICADFSRSSATGQSGSGGSRVRAEYCACANVLRKTLGRSTELCLPRSDRCRLPPAEPSPATAFQTILDWICTCELGDSRARPIKTYQFEFSDHTPSHVVLSVRD